MTDNSDSKPDRFLDQFNIPTEHAYTYLWDRGLHKATCPICSNKDWVEEIRPDPENNQIDYTAAAFLPKDPRGFFGPAPHIPMMVFTCTACGFIRQHNLTWLDRKFREGNSNG